MTNTLTLDNLKDFIRRRNRSEFVSNFQFGIDANAAGVSLDDLGAATRTETGYLWNTPFGQLAEHTGLGCGKMALWHDGTLVFGDSRVRVDKAVLAR